VIAENEKQRQDSLLTKTIEKQKDIQALERYS